MLYLMAKNPEAQEELYQQIRSVLGDRTEPTPEDLSKIPYLKGCMMESFRCVCILFFACYCTKGKLEWVPWTCTNQHVQKNHVLIMHRPCMYYNSACVQVHWVHYRPGSTYACIIICKLCSVGIFTTVTVIYAHIYMHGSYAGEIISLVSTLNIWAFSTSLKPSQHGGI